MLKIVGDISYLVTIVGLNCLLVFMLVFTKFAKTLMSFALTGFFFVVTVILDLSATTLFVPAAREFIVNYVRTPAYVILAISTWILVFASWDKALMGAKKRKAEKKVDILPLDK